ncbi:hypothetical protein JHK82_013080 [Glycine max]|nr:hypothetical protein JHK85_013447 [Glycine max]KAG5058111.1 hypothetical protein JHK86_013107 [Glycine max]KAG5155111.1 hypothetical protein JHK82_013080 [Glycine max]
MSSPVISEILLSGFTINSSLRRRTHLVQSFSVVFLHWFYIRVIIVQIADYCMASPGGSGTYSSGSSSLQNSGSEGDRDIMEQRKRKRMLSNRESARRSRIRKQQHLEGLSAQLDQLKKENAQINTNISITTQMYLNVEAENAILRAQMGELSNRLNSLNEMISFINSTNNNCLMMFDEAQETTTQLFNDCGFMDYAWNGIPIMASADNEMLIMY